MERFPKRYDQIRIIDGRSYYAILNESGEPVPCNFDTWGSWFGGNQRILEQDMIDGFKVSTVFVGCYWYFETMVFDPAGESIWRENTWTKADAMAGHELAKRLTENGEIRTALEHLSEDRTSQFGGPSDTDRDDDIRDQPDTTTNEI
jgi:hypothetical protein